jgi:hypothetical protein
MFVDRRFMLVAAFEQQSLRCLCAYMFCIMVGFHHSLVSRTCMAGLGLTVPAAFLSTAWPWCGSGMPAAAIECYGDKSSCFVI